MAYFATYTQDQIVNEYLCNFDIQHPLKTVYGCMISFMK